MQYDLRIGSSGRRIILWSENKDEELFLSGFVGKAKVQKIYDGHPTHNRVKQVAIYFEDEEEPECT